MEPLNYSPDYLSLLDTSSNCPLNTWNAH